MFQLNQIQLYHYVEQIVPLITFDTSERQNYEQQSTDGLLRSAIREIKFENSKHERCNYICDE